MLTSLRILWLKWQIEIIKFKQKRRNRLHFPMTEGRDGGA